MTPTLTALRRIDFDLEEDARGEEVRFVPVADDGDNQPW